MNDYSTIYKAIKADSDPTSLAMSNREHAWEANKAAADGNMADARDHAHLSRMAAMRVESIAREAWVARDIAKAAVMFKLAGRCHYAAMQAAKHARNGYDEGNARSDAETCTRHAADLSETLAA